MTEDIVKFCSVCGHDGTGKRHLKCDAQHEGVRCNGEWSEKSVFTSPMKVIVSEIPEITEEITLENYEHICTGIKNKQFHRNFEACINKYNMRCSYYNLCHKKDMGGLIQD